MRFRPPQPREGGFTLVELMVVMLIILVLIAISIAMFLGARRAAQDRAAQSLAREALASAKTLFTAEDDYTVASLTELRTAEPSIEFRPRDASSTGPHNVSVDAPDTMTFVAAVYSRTGTCFFIRDSATSQVPGTSYGRKASEGTDCMAGDLSGVTFTQRW